MNSVKNLLGQVIIVVGAQWGDEGKGKLVDILSQEYDITARSAGGANAGHTIYIGDTDEKAKKFVFHLIPSGMLNEDKECVIGSGCVVHLPTLIGEIEMLKKENISVKNRLFISDRAHLIFDYHQLIDQIQEEAKGDQKVGTTNRGIGPAYTDKSKRIGIRMGDLINGFEVFAEKLRKNIEKHQTRYGFEYDVEKEINRYKGISEIMDGMVVDTSYYLNEAIQQGKTILLEGAQGTHLDLDGGTYPYVTSSNTIAGGACAGVGIGPKKIDSVIGIVKAYTTRVGEGPFPTELTNENGVKLQKFGGEYGATTGRPRRCGWFDVPVVDYAVQVNGLTSINLTKLDVLSDFEKIKIAVKYKCNDEELKSFPANLDVLKNVEVEYLEMSGWQEDITNVKTFEELPLNAQKYVLEIEKLIGVPVNFIGVGMRRNQMIVR